MNNKTQDSSDNGKSYAGIQAEAEELDSALLDKFGDPTVVGFLTLQASLGAMADQLESIGLLDKKEWLLESISRRREMLKD